MEIIIIIIVIKKIYAIQFFLLMDLNPSSGPGVSA